MNDRKNFIGMSGVASAGLALSSSPLFAESLGKEGPEPGKTV